MTAGHYSRLGHNLDVLECVYLKWHGNTHTNRSVTQAASNTSPPHVFPINNNNKKTLTASFYLPALARSHFKCTSGN